ncbi:MAG: tryptophan synthase subunit alpha [Candidatus Altiarchaeota archaeon]|nr:tryptophan synthase subunit alpha [Candidatus Altiarchaeota archaeon]
MNLSDRLKDLKKKKEGALIGFITTGDPAPDDTVEIANALIKGGIDVLELGLPFSDPVADGPVIQKAGERAISAGMNTDVYFRIAKKIKNIPKACMTYYNLVLQRGLERFADDCIKAGISGLIIPDLPLEEAGELLSVCKKKRISLIFFAAPTTTDERLGKTLREAGGFLYVVSVTGVTGERKELSTGVGPLIKRIKKKSGELPLAVGFGISKPKHARDVISSGADAAIVGSAFIRIIEKDRDNRKEMLARLEAFARELKDATKWEET